MCSWNLRCEMEKSRTVCSDLVERILNKAFEWLMMEMVETTITRVVK